MIKRDIYLNKLIKSRNNGFPKIITGIRRCGKSYLLKEIYKNYLIEDGVDENLIISIDLENLNNYKYRDPFELDFYIRSICSSKEKIYYVFIDEIQLVNELKNPIFSNGIHTIASKDDVDTVGFIEVVLGLSKENNIDLYLTGSNSKMLSNEIATKFRDRATNINLFPLSFYEFYLYIGGSKKDALDTYLLYGGMPLVVLEDDKQRKKDYLKGLFNLTYLKDILEKNKVDKTEFLDELCNILSSETGCLINSNRISDIYMSRKKLKIDPSTVNKYINYFIDSYLIQEAKRYDIKGHKELGSLKKYYYIDNGLRNARLNFNFQDRGFLLENIIYNELKFNGYTINIGKVEKIEKDKNGKSIRKEYEIDFIAEKDERKFYIQVTDNIINSSVYEREIKPFISVNNQIKKILVVNDEIESFVDDYGFIVMSASKFMLEYIV